MHYLSIENGDINYHVCSENFSRIISKIVQVSMEYHDTFDITVSNKKIYDYMNYTLLENPEVEY